MLATVLLVVIGWHAYQYSLAGVAWGLFVALFTSVIPFAVIICGVRRGALTDHHISRREQRRIPLLIALGCLGFGLVALVILGAHRELLAGLVAGGLGVLVSVIVNLRWKMSIHTGVAAGALVVLAEAFGGWALFATPLVGLVAWSRVHLRDHTFAKSWLGPCWEFSWQDLVSPRCANSSICPVTSPATGSISRAGSRARLALR